MVDPAVFLLLLSAVGCKSGARSSLTLDAGVRAVPSVLTAPTSKQEDEPMVDLLHTVEATVAMSSLVDNEQDRPEHLVDGRADTAWNSKTGDLRGWIAFRLPRATRVTRVELTAGFDKQSAAGDLFTMNHRIKRVRLLREGVVVSETTLDIESRILQGMDVEAEGGDFKLEVLETVPGTKQAWRELSVSEFRVWGQVGDAPRSGTQRPRLAIGSLDGVPEAKARSSARVSRGPFPTIVTLCAANDRVMSPLLRAKLGEDAYPSSVGFGPGVHCRKGEQYGLEPAMFASSPFEDAALIDFDDLEQYHTSLALKTSKGWYRTDVHVLSHDHMDPGCLHAERTRIEDVRTATTATGQRVAILRFVDRDTSWAQQKASDNASIWRERAYACRLDSSESPSCEGPKFLATIKVPNPANFNFEDERSFAVEFDAIRWGQRKQAVLGPAGELRAE